MLRAEELAGPAASDERLQELAALLEASDTMADYGAASGTLDKDDLAYEFWEIFNERYGWDPLITAEEATRQPDLHSNITKFVTSFVTKLALGNVLQRLLPTW